MTDPKSGGYQMLGTDLDDEEAIVDMTLTKECQVLPESVEWNRTDEKPVAVFLGRLVLSALVIIGAFIILLKVWCV